MDYQPGKTYEVTFTDGSKAQLLFEGFGSNMQPMWQNVLTGERSHLLQPFVSATLVP